MAVTGFLRDRYWRERTGRRPNVVLAITGADDLFGYGSWKHRDATLDGQPARVVYVPWFGIQERFRGELTSDGQKGSGVLYATLEAGAMEHPSSTPDMPIILDCDAANERGLAFWEARGFEPFELFETQSGSYVRLRR